MEEHPSDDDFAIAGCTDQDDGFAIAGCGADSSGSDGFGIAGTGGVSSTDPLPKRRRKRDAKPLEMATAAASFVCAFLVVDHELSTPHYFVHMHVHSADGFPRFEGSPMLAVVAVVILSYILRRDGVDATEHMTVLARDAKRKRRYVSGHVLGYCDYYIKAVYGLDQPFDLHDREELQNIMAPLGWRDALSNIGFGAEDLLLSEICRKHSCDLPSICVPVSMVHGELIVKELTTALKCAAVSKNNKVSHFVLGFPLYRNVKKWVQQMLRDDSQREHILEDDAAPHTFGPMLELPAGTPDNPQSGRIWQGREQHDGIALLKWMRFSRHLLAQRSVSEAIDDGLDAGIEDENVKSAAQDSRSRVPAADVLIRGRLKLDATAMALERRMFKDIILNRSGELVGLYLFSDGSPVTGQEIQGMLMDLVWKDNLITRFVLPGIALAFGAFGLMSKAFALLWSWFLVVGPWEYGLNWIASHCRCITTDMGTELEMLMVPNFIRGFLAYITGKSMSVVRGLVDRSTRLLSRALRIADWSHMFDNLMTIKKAPPYPPTRKINENKQQLKMILKASLNQNKNLSLQSCMWPPYIAYC